MGQIAKKTAWTNFLYPCVNESTFYDDDEDDHNDDGCAVRFRGFLGTG